MARTRIISQTKALYVSPTGLLASNYGGSNVGASGVLPRQLHRIDTVSFDVDLAGARTDVFEFGQLDRIDTIRTSEVAPSLSFGYYITDGENEDALGFSIRGLTTGSLPKTQFISGLLAEDIHKKEKNVYIVTVPEGIDAFDPVNFEANRTQHNVVGLGNASLSNYSLNFAVGEIPRVDVDMECGNLVFYTGQSSGLRNPANNRLTGETADTGLFVLPAPSTGDSAITVLKPSDVVVSFSNNNGSMGGITYDNICVQSAAIEVPVSREALECLGSELPFARPLQTPINVTCSINALVKDFASGSLQTVLTGSISSNPTNITVTVNNGTKDQLKFLLNQSVLDNQNFATALDSQETVDLTFSAQIGGASSTGAGFFMTGAYNPLGGLTDIPSFSPATVRYADQP
jgi:hypothetical protein